MPYIFPTTPLPSYPTPLQANMSVFRPIQAFMYVCGICVTYWPVLLPVKRVVCYAGCERVYASVYVLGSFRQKSQAK